MGVDGIFGRSDIAAITNDSVTAAGNLITKLKDAEKNAMDFWPEIIKEVGTVLIDVLVLIAEEIENND